MDRPNPPVVLIIRDGWGENPNPEHHECNAVKLARTPVADDLAANWPQTLVTTCGVDVGLPPGTMGNSEVGHQNIGAGRIVDQELRRISHTIDDGSFYSNAALRDTVRRAISTGTRLHVMGLVSDGRVHSAMDHLFAVIELARRESIPPDDLLIHVFTDGRDTPPTSSLGYVGALEDRLREAGVGRIATVIGRFFAMDRDHRWERVEQAWGCLTGRSTTATADSALAAIRHSHEHPLGPGQDSDEFLVPTTIVNDDGTPVGTIGDGDNVIFFNFRGDRPREITRAFILDDAAWASVPNGGFNRGPALKNLHYCAMSRYEAGLPFSAVAFDKPPKMPDILGRVVADAGLRQFRCAETEKYPHVTFFFNDYREEPFPGEQRTVVPSPRDVTTYDQKPEMSAERVCRAVLDRLAANDCEELIVVNFANPDMVGHTGKLDAVITAVETTDACVGRIVEATLARQGRLVITADHGNAEQMWNYDANCPHTSHTTYDVPLFVVGDDCAGRPMRDGGRLADVAPTVLSLMGLDVPDAMTGASLLTVEAST